MSAGGTTTRGPGGTRTLLQTEYPFTLPRGYVDSLGNLHREGVMRLATAMDVIHPQKDPRVQPPNDAYLIVILLSRVVTKLGTVDAINPAVIERLFASDLAFLQEFYERINSTDGGHRLRCPHCQQEFEREYPPMGE